MGGFLTVCAGILAYGALVESNKLTIEMVNLELEGWPAELEGFRIAFIADLHVRDEYSCRLAQRAIEQALLVNPDLILFGGDFVAYPNARCLKFLSEALQPIRAFKGKRLTCLGNHDYKLKPCPKNSQRNQSMKWTADGDSPIVPILQEYGITCLENGICDLGPVIIAGIGCATLGLDDAPLTITLASSYEKPVICLWHEPDMVDELPLGSCLMLSGHSHGGQFTFWWGWTPLYTELGRRYPRGYYPNTKTPLYVSRGVGTTGPPSRLNCAPEVSILTLSKAPLAIESTASKVN